MNLLRHGCARLVVGNVGEWRGIVRRWQDFRFSARVRPLFVESQKFLNQDFWKQSDFDACFVQR
jgi:hypothetical protein